MKTSSTSTSTHRIKELEETVTHLQEEINDVKNQRSALEKRLETTKQCTKSSKEEIAELTVQIDSLKQQNHIISSDLINAQSKIIELSAQNNSSSSSSASSSSTSPEVQALEEENLELLKENKELRKDVATYKSQIDKMNTIYSISTVTGATGGCDSTSSSSSSFHASSSAAAAAVTLGTHTQCTPRKFGTELGKRQSILENIQHSKILKVDDNKSSKCNGIASATITEAPAGASVSGAGVVVTDKMIAKENMTTAALKKVRNRRMSGPLAGVDEGVAGGDCNQS